MGKVLAVLGLLVALLIVAITALLAAAKARQRELTVGWLRLLSAGTIPTSRAV
jgi:hypothetical protein